MRKISIEQLTPGMILARSLYSSDGKTLLGAGITVSAPFIKRLQKIGIPAVFIKDQLIDDLPLPQVISEEVRNATIKTVRDIFQRVQLAGENKINAKEVKKAVSRLLDEVISNRHILIHMSDIRSHDDYTFGHSVNVAVLSIMTGLAMGYNELQLRDLACGALLHDLGKMLVPLEILNKPGALTDDEFREIQKHSNYGFELIRNQREEFSSLSAHVAFQHHERFDGSGYPRGLKGEGIHEYARIVAIADMYDALVADRVYRKAFLPYQAHEMILAATTHHLDPTIAQSFLQNIAIYPIGSVVQLSSLEIGIVVDVNKLFQTRPVVRLIASTEGQPLTDCVEIDLTRHPTLFINKILTENETNQLLYCTREEQCN
ncbi:HD-GYP domain-containing protein [Heliorestis acidaminivorans]|uniref:HD-GYP domain-containing protein n=1 Tax=Heliorestis acidaminivorans TaxID=553427 RepID=A0A6I0ETF6_9FIRM|nr:HD-GYP domain-containing protein [Heliorestis acidaminivorans]KAB2953359.1 HD-GYP domain-containing protein [Heliorestis acidaminivorans]